MKHTLNSSYQKLFAGVLVVLLALAGLSIYFIVESTPAFIHTYQLRAADKTAIATVESTTSEYVKYTGLGRGNSEDAYDLARVSYVVVDPVTELKTTYTADRAVHTPEPGETITVFYNSEDPQDSTTEVEVLFAKDFWRYNAIFAAFFTAAGVIGLHLLLKGYTLQQKSHKK